MLEARDRVGGRVWSVPFAGAVVERGAEFILPHDKMPPRVDSGSARTQGDAVRQPGAAGARCLDYEVLRQSAAQLAAAGKATVRRSSSTGCGGRSKRGSRSAARTGTISSDRPERGAGAFGDFDSVYGEGGNDRIARELAAGLGMRCGGPLVASVSRASLRRADRVAAGRVEAAAPPYTAAKRSRAAARVPVCPSPVLDLDARTRFWSRRGPMTRGSAAPTRRGRRSSPMDAETRPLSRARRGRVLFRRRAHRRRRGTG